MSASPAPEASLWREYKTDEGRLYWSHKTTKQSVWEKPNDLKTPFERALAKTDWKQYTSKDRPYYVHSKTKETKWDLPPDLVELKKKVDEDEAYMAERKSRRERGQSSPTPPPRSASPEHLRPGSHNAMAAFRRRETSTPTQKPVERIFMPPGGFVDHDRAVAAFIHLLKREGIDETWTWDQTMRKIIMDPLYKALDTLAEKKKAFEKHISDILAERRAAKEARLEELRPIFVRLFESTPEIKAYSTMKTAAVVLKRDRSWREANEEEQRILLDEWTTDQRRREEEMENRLKQRNLDTLSTLVKDLDLNVGTRWRAAYEVIVGAPAFRDDSQLQKMEVLDILTVWEGYSRQLEQEHDTESKRLRTERLRKGRKAREGFVALLHELKHDGLLTRTTKWKELYPRIKKDQRYEDLLGIQGSSPLELWMDIVDDLQDEVERAAEKIEQALRRDQKELAVDTKRSEYDEWVKDVSMDDRVKKEVYDFLHDELVQKAADEARRAERKRRHRMDDLRYALRKVQRIDIEMTYDEAEPFMKDLPEFKDISEEEDRKAAYEKFIKRQQEKLREEKEEGTSERRSSRMEVDEDDKGKDRERERRPTKEREHDEKRSRRDSEYESKDKERRDRDRGSERDREREGKDHRRRDSDRKKRYSVEHDDRDRDPKRARRESVNSPTKKRDDDVEEGEI